MWETIFDASDITWLHRELRFTVEWIFVVMVFTVIAYLRKAPRFFTTIGCVFVLFGVYINISTLYYYHDDRLDLLESNFTVITGVPEKIYIGHNTASFEVNNIVFKGRNHSTTTSITTNIVEKLTNSDKVRVTYLRQEDSHVRYKNKILKVDIL